MRAWLNPRVDLLGTPSDFAWVDPCYGRTDGRTNEESWLGHIDHLTLRNAHAHIRISPFAPIAQARTAAKEKP
jgi:hypothetical protein